MMEKNNFILRLKARQALAGHWQTALVVMLVASLPSWLAQIASLAACLCLLVLGSWKFLMTPYGSVRMQINPDVQITVNQLDYVIGLEGLNEDGEDLIEGYSYRWKSVDTASDELADRAMEMGYLKEGGAIRLTVESDHAQWRKETEDRIILELEVHVGKSITITTEPAANERTQTNPSSQLTETDMPASRPDAIIIPVPSDTNAPPVVSGDNDGSGHDHDDDWENDDEDSNIQNDDSDDDLSDDPDDDDTGSAGQSGDQDDEQDDLAGDDDSPDDNSGQSGDDDKDDLGSDDMDSDGDLDDDHDDSGDDDDLPDGDD